MFKYVNLKMGAERGATEPSPWRSLPHPPSSASLRPPRARPPQPRPSVLFRVEGVGFISCRLAGWQTRPGVSISFSLGTL